MPSNREQFFNCFRPILFPMFVTGFSSFRINRKSKFEISTFTKVYTYVARAVSIGFFVLGTALKFESNTFSKRVRALSPLIQFIGLADLVFTIGTYINISSQLEVEKKRHVQLYERAFELDTAMVKPFSVNFNYHKTIRKNKIYMSAINFYCGVYFSLYMLMLDPEWRVILLGIGYSLCTAGTAAFSYGHMILMDYLRVRFRLLQKMFRKRLYMSSKRELRERANVFLLMNCYQNYCEFIKDINRTYGYIAVTLYFHDFVQISSMVFVLCHKASESRNNVGEYVALFLFVLPRLIKHVYVAVYSRLTNKENEACFHIIKKYDIRFPYKEVKDQIDGLLWWKRLNNFDFTIGKALRSNFGLVFSVFNGVANYILILMQLKTQEASIEERIGIRKHN